MTIRVNTLAHVGQSIPGVDSRDKLTGGAVYTTDLAFPGMLHGKILRSTQPHARIRSIDVSAAVSMDGVVAVVTGADLAGLDPYYGMFIRDQTVLATDKVRYVGEPVVAVAALNEALAYRAIESIRIEYEPLPALMTTEEALAPDAAALFAGLHAHALPPAPPNSTYLQEPSPNVLFEYRYGYGDTDELLRQSAHVFEHTFEFARISHYGLEPHVSIARADSDGIEVWSNNQDPFLLRQDIARIFGLSLDRVRFHAGLVGGGFGAKSYCKIEPIAVLLARKSNRPVRLALTMSESMMTVCEHAAKLRLRSGVGASGETLVRDAFIDLDGGAYADASPSVAMRIGARFGGPYRWRSIRVNVRVIRTTTIPAGSFRGFGAAHTTWASESQIDDIARKVGQDPVAFRMRNLTPLGSSCAPGENPFDSDLHLGLRAIADRIGFGLPRQPRRGIGVAVAIKGAGASHHADASVEILPSGAVRIAAGVTEIGQSTRTVMTQIAAEILRVEPDRITVVDIDTSQTPFDAGTHASCGVTVSGSAMREAADNARSAVLAFAGEELGCEVSELEFRNFNVWCRGTCHALADLVAHRKAATEPLFHGEGSRKTAGGAYFWMPSWTAAEVEVDIETGAYKVLRLVTAVDVGMAINPQRCMSQAEGGAVQGLGQAMFEHLDYAEQAAPNAEPLKYRVPRISDIPTNFDTLILEQGHGPGPFGAKGVGEAGNLTIPAAIANAIADATGARVNSLPLTPDKVLRAIRATPGLSTHHLTRTLNIP
jgi:CO/xanthine dehydrogenase Mo-binding subunit